MIGNPVRKQYECARQGINIEEDKTARRRVLGDSVYEIRFFEMSQEDFAKYVSPTGILTDAELVSVFKKFSGLDVADLKWKKYEKKRCACSVISFSRFDLANAVSGQWLCPGNKFDALTLTINKPVLFHGVRLFGDSSGSQYEVKFTIKNETVTGTYTSEQDDDGVWGYEVMLLKPISLLPSEDFTIIARVQGPDSHRGIRERSSVKVDSIVVIFKDAPIGLSQNGTNKKKGQFFKIFLSQL